MIMSMKDFTQIAGIMQMNATETPVELAEQYTTYLAMDQVGREQFMHALLKKIKPAVKRLNKILLDEGI